MRPSLSVVSGSLICAAIAASAPFSDHESAGVVRVPFTEGTVSGNEKRDVPSGVIGIPFTKGVKTGHFKRATLSEDLENGRYLNFLEYLADVEVGTPPQVFKSVIDTGSSDVWFYYETINGTGFDLQGSSTIKDGDQEFSMKYASASFAGSWVYDTVTLAGATVEEYPFGVVPAPAAEENQFPDGVHGVFGIGYILGEGVSAGKAYNNFPQRLKNEGKIASNSYSFYFDDWDTKTGTLLLGGLDTAKYHDQLYTIPVQSRRGGFLGLKSVTSSFLVNFKVSANGGKSSSTIQGLLDTGTSFTYLPDDEADSLAKQVGAVWDEESQQYIFQSYPTGAYLTYDFSGVQIQVPTSELAIPLSELNSQSTSETLIFTILPESHIGRIILGDTFIRSAYVVFDLDNNEIGIAQANWNATDSNIVAITDGIPGAQPAPGDSKSSGGLLSGLFGLLGF